MDRSDYRLWDAKEVARLVAVSESSRRYFQDILARAPVGLLVVSSRMRFVMANRRLRELLNLRAEEISRIAQVLPFEPLRKHVAEVLGSGKPQHGIILDLERPGAPSRRLRADLEYLESWHGEEREVLVFVQDVTPYDRSAAIADVPSIIWEADAKESRFTFINDLAESLLGYPRSRWFAETGFWPGRIHPADRSRVLALYQAAIADGADRACEYRAISAAGAVVWLHETIHPVDGEGGEVAKLVGAASDITGHRELYQRALNIAKTDALARLAADIGQEFGNALTVISASAEEIARQAFALEAIQAEVSDVLSAAGRASVLAHQLLAYAYVGGRTRRPFDVHEMISGLHQNMRGRLPAGVGIDITSGAAAPYVDASADDVREALSALIEYAARSIGEGTIEIEVGVSECVGVAEPPPGEETRAYALITIRYSGREPDEEALSRLFEPVFRTGPPGPSSAIPNAYRAIRQNGGEVWIRGEPGGRVAIGICLRKAPPAVSPAPGEVVLPSPPETVPPERGPETEAAGLKRVCTVFVVEDEASVRSLITRTLENQGYRVIAASGGAAALELAATHPGSVDLLITDVLMPGMSGSELADQFAVLRPGTKVLYVSGYADNATIQSRLVPPRTAFLQKPFTLKSLVDKVREMLEQ